MKLFRAIFTAILMVFVADSIAIASEPSLMARVEERISELASNDGFSDDDAISTSVFFLEYLIGPKPNDQKLISRVVLSKAENVRVFVAYDFGIGFSGYEFEFRRGDQKKGMRWAHFLRLIQIPSE